MKQKILVESNGEKLYKGNIMNIPVKKSYIVEKSIELFDDDDPCIIHTSFVIKHFAEDLIDLFKDQNTDILHGKDHPDALDFIACDDVSTLRVKKL